MDGLDLANRMRDLPDHMLDECVKRMVAALGGREFALLRDAVRAEKHWRKAMDAKADERRRLRAEHDRKARERAAAEAPRRLARAYQAAANRALSR